MKQFLFAGSALVFAFGFATPSFAATAAECQAVFTKADTNHDSAIDGDEVAPYAKAAKAAGLHIADDNKITQPEFMPACEKGVFDGLPQLHSQPGGPRAN
jgi:hypothetical protein